jgi:prevent-host-death family protein
MQNLGHYEEGRGPSWGGRRPTSLTAFLENCTVQLAEMESLMSTTPTVTGKNGIVVSALRARANFGKLLNRVEAERRSLIIEKRGTPRAVIMSIRDYVKMAAPEPEVLRIIGEESVKKGTNTLTSRQIDQIIKATRAEKKKH